MTRTLRFLFGFSEAVGRKPFIAWGFGLMALKVTVETVVWSFAVGEWLSPHVFLNPLGRWGMFRVLGEHGIAVSVLMGLFALPFLWIGVSMSTRRAADGGLSPWVGLLFFVPFLNYLLMLGLSILPHDPGAWRESSDAPLAASPLGERYRSAGIAILIGALYALAMGALSIFGFEKYGASLFIGTPVVMGAAAGFVFNLRRVTTLHATVGVACLATLLVGGAMFLFAMEGVICILMAAPIAFCCAIAGALVGRAIAIRWNGPRIQGALVLVALPGLAYLEPTPLPTFEVRSAVEVNAPAEKVWPYVVKFPDLAPPTEWLFRAGVAYPMRARLEGTGVGATRYCEFSTGAFVEPITAWETERRLAFDVKFQPHPMRELSPFENVTAPHLDGYFRSTAGEFRLVPLPNGRTRLEGSTWYQLEIYPVPYWRVYSEAIVHSIHGRVLEHIRTLAEGKAAR